METVQLQEQLYQGDYTTVYKAIHSEKNVIVKILKEQFPSLKQIARFNEEYDITNRFDITGSRKALFKQKINDRHALVLEYVEGNTLKEYIRKAKEQNQQITLLDFLRIAVDTVKVLAQIHENQVIHKDINPKNIIIQPNGGSYIIDFGIADIIKKQAQKQNPDNLNALEGTLAYISPEQTGRMNRSIDHRSDLYSFGISLYELWTNQLPFPDDEDTMEIIHNHMAKNPTAILDLRSDTPIMLINIINKLLSKTPESRYQSTYGLHYDLEKCLNLYQKEGKISKFELGESDFLDLFRIPEKLYGRDNERQKLLQLFDETTKGGLEMMLVGGFSGIGKTALVNEIHKPVTERRGSFISGKFEQYQKDTPYSAVISAITDFTEQLLAKPQVQIEKWKKLILDAVGINGQVLIDVIPSLEHLLGTQPPVPELAPTETQNRFRTLFQQFIRVVSTESHPLVIFLDDWQWADIGSIELLKTLMKDTENKYVLVLCAYRSNEVTKAHPFMLSLDDIRRHGKIPHKIKLEALPLNNVNELVSDTLHLQKSETKPLSELIAKKTEGNPFFLTQLFTSLYENGDIIYNHDTKKWTWSIEHIANLDVTGNVVDLMIDKIQKLDKRTQQILQTASCIGNKFSLTILASLSTASQKNILDDLWQALEEGLLITITGNPYAVEETTVDAGVYFKFLHDRVEQAAYSLVSDEIKKQNRLRIGRSIIQNQPAEYIEEFLFDIVNYLNAGRELIIDKEELTRLAELNFRVGKKAKKSTAYMSATEFFETADELLGQSKWTEHYDLTVQLYTEWGETLFLVSDKEKSDSVLDEGLQYARTNTDKSRFYVIKINRDSMEYKYTEATLKVIEVLKLFNIHLPDVHDVEAIEKETTTELVKYHKYMETHDIQSFRYLPPIEDTEKRMMVDIMCKAVADVFMGVPQYFTYYMTKIMNTVAEYGLSKYIGPGYSFFAIVLSAFRKYEDAYQLTDLNYKLLIEDNFSHSSDIGKIYVIRPYYLLLKRSYQETVDAFLETYKQSANVGDWIYAAFGFAICARYNIALNLENAWRLAEQVARFCSDTGNVPIGLFITKIFAIVRNLRGETQDLDVLTCDEFDEKSFVETFEEGAPVLAALFKRFQMWIYVIYELYDHVFKFIDERDRWLPPMEGIDIIAKADYNLFMVLAITGKYEELSPEDKKKYYPVVENSLQELETLADHSTENFGSYYELMKAEKARIDGQDAIVVISSLMQAVKYAKKAKFLSHEGLANEYLGKMYMTLEDMDIASTYIKRAKYAYEIWGATRKAELLENKYSQFFNESTESDGSVTIHRTARKGTTIHSRQGATSTVQSVGLDFQTIIKASQAISSEVKLDTLLSKMLDIVIENAGAGRGVIVRPLDNKFHILADRTTEESRQISSDIELKKRLPLTLIRYVTRSQNTIVLDDARKDKTYGEDTYVIQNDVKSVLCIPVIQQGKVSILIYLENKLVDYVFTSGRVNTLNLLMGQVAVSFENALLYDNMEQEIEKQTSEIKDKSNRITASIQYAQNIQNAILPATELLNELYDDHYILYLPKDIVSGDFYWARKTKNYIFTAVVDCTGHGVPGAFMSMIGKTLLDEILSEKGIDEPAAMLLQLHLSVRASLRQGETDNDDGMDLGLIRLEYQNNGLAEVVFSGAKRPLFIMSDGEFTELKGDRKSIGGHSAVAREFTNQVYPLKSGDTLYLLSDGITDVASPKRKMFGKKRVRELIQKYAHTDSLKQQGEMLHEAMKAHQQDTEQRDDITVMGVRIK